MPKDWVDRIIMFSVIGLVVWAIIGLPILYGQSSYYGPTKQAEQNGCTPGQSGRNSKSGCNRSILIEPKFRADGGTQVSSNDCDCCCNQPEKGWWNRLWTDPNATFAGAIAFLTLGLVVVGAFQVQINRLQYRATVVLEAPIITVASVKLVEYPDETTELPIRDHIIGGEFPHFARILVLISNSGRTEAKINEMCLEWLVARALPGFPVYQKIMSANFTLQAGEQIWIRFDPSGNVRLSEDEREGMSLNVQSFWAYGYFIYSDSRSKKFKRSFLVRWDYVQGFVPEVVPEYTGQ